MKKWYLACLLKVFLTPSCVYCRYTQPKQLDAACKWRHKSGPCSTAICYGRYKSPFWWTWQQTSTNTVTEQQLLYVCCQTIGSCSVLWRSCNDRSMSKEGRRNGLNSTLSGTDGKQQDPWSCDKDRRFFLFELLNVPLVCQLLWGTDILANSRLCFIVNSIIPALFVPKKS